MMDPYLDYWINRIKLALRAGEFRRAWWYKRHIISVVRWHFTNRKMKGVYFYSTYLWLIGRVPRHALDRWYWRINDGPNGLWR